MKLLLTGAYGMVGLGTRRQLDQLGVDVHPTGRDPGLSSGRQLDVTDARRVSEVLEESRPDAVLHLAAYTDVDACETDDARARAVNAGGTATLAEHCARLGIRLVYVSTAAVFSGEHVRGYDETDTPAPANAYARTKLAGERAVEAMGGGYTILRAGWMFGFWRSNRFVPAIFSQIADGAREIRAVDDRVGTATSAVDLARAALALVEEGADGLFHLANGPGCTRYDLAREIVATLGRTDIEVVPVSAASFVERAPRPRHEVLRTIHTDHPVLGSIPSWREAIRAHVRTDLAPNHS